MRYFFAAESQHEATLSHCQPSSRVKMQHSQRNQGSSPVWESTLTRSCDERLRLWLAASGHESWTQMGISVAPQGPANRRLWWRRRCEGLCTVHELEIRKQMGCRGPLGLHKTCSSFDRSFARFKMRFPAEKVTRKIPRPPDGELETVSRWRPTVPWSGRI